MRQKPKSMSDAEFRWQTNFLKALQNKPLAIPEPPKRDCVPPYAFKQANPYVLSRMLLQWCLQFVVFKGRKAKKFAECYQKVLGLELVCHAHLVNDYWTMFIEEVDKSDEVIVRFKHSVSILSFSMQVQQQMLCTAFEMWCASFLQETCFESDIWALCREGRQDVPWKAKLIEGSSLYAIFEGINNSLATSKNLSLTWHTFILPKAEYLIDELSLGYERLSINNSTTQIGIQVFTNGENIAPASLLCRCCLFWK